MSALLRHLELRTSQRITFGTELSFSYRRADITYVGTGRTTNCSDGAICFETDQKLEGKPELELRLLCPVQLQNICQLELIIRGRLVRKDASLAVVRMEHYEFHTLGEKSFDALQSRGVTCNLLV